MLRGAHASYLTGLIRPVSPPFSWLCVEICISLIKILQMCQAEFSFICLVFLFFIFFNYANPDNISGKEPHWRCSNVKNRGAAVPSSMVCFIIQRIGTLNRYYIIVVSIPDTLIVIPPTHSLSGRTGCTIPACILCWAVLNDVASDSCSRQQGESCCSVALAAVIYHRK